MDIHILAVGDVVGAPGLEILKHQLPRLRREEKIDFCAVNGENAAMTGMTPAQAEELLAYGADVITLGNHTWGQKALLPYLDETERVLRPANFAPQNPGTGVGIFEAAFGSVAVVNLIGRCNLAVNADNPFYKIDGILKKLDKMPVLVDLHAEATSEKLAMGFYLDGRVSAVWGTHTHVPTADLRILPKGTGYITDLGMTGAKNSALGIDPQQSIALFRGELPDRYRPAEGEKWLCGAIFTVDTESGKCLAVRQVQITE